MLQIAVTAAFVAAAAIYAAPSVIAIMKGHRRWPLVVTLDIMLGWSIVGWLLALVIVLDVMPRRSARTKRTRKPRARPAVVPRRADDNAASERDVQDPPFVREDAYAAWLEEGAALDTEPRASNSA